MTPKAKPKTIDRRVFLKRGLGLAGGVALVAAAKPGRARERMSTPEVEAPRPSQRGYQETPHILEYYRLAKL